MSKILHSTKYRREFPLNTFQFLQYCLRRERILRNLKVDGTHYNSSEDMQQIFTICRYK